jgi:hypothetical protein
MRLVVAPFQVDYQPRSATALPRQSDASTKGFHFMTKPAIARTAEASTDAQTKSDHAAEKIVEGNAAALTDSGDASRAGFQELTQAYQDLATKNASDLSAAVRALSAVKTPAEFAELQQNLVEAVQKTEGS